MIAITDEPIDPAAVLASVQDKEHGALVVFVGTVRSRSEGRNVRAIEYEAYRDLATRTLAEIAEEAQRQWVGVRLAVVHRVGTLRVGEASIVIAAGGAHRADPFAACRHVIERIKKTVPIWKKEIFEDGESWVGV